MTEGIKRPRDAERSDDARLRQTHESGGKITRQRIVDIALGYVEDGDDDSLTMRALGARLGVSSMAIYRYFASKEEILDAVVDVLLARVAKPTAPEKKWDEWIEQSARALRECLVRYPAALKAFTSHPVTTPAALARMDAGLRVLRAAGFDGSHAARAFAAVHTYTIGFSALEVSRARTRPPAGIHAGAQYWHLFFGTLPPEQFPNLVELAPDLARFTSEEQFGRGLQTLLLGLRTELGAPTDTAR